MHNKARFMNSTKRSLRRSTVEQKSARTAVLAVAFALFLLLLGAPAAAAPFFTASLDSGQEVDPGGQTNSPATGSSNLELFESAPGIFSLSYSLSISDELNFGPVAAGTPVDQITGENDVILLHIHNEARGANGPVVFGIFNPNDDNDPTVTFNPDGTTTISGVWDPDEGSQPLSNFVDQLLAAAPGDDVALYWNAHTVSDPAGAIRGQLAAPASAPIPEPTSVALLGLGLVGLGCVKRRKAR